MGVVSDDVRVAEIAGKLTKAHIAALQTLPQPGWKPDRAFVGVGRSISYSSTWRKSASHYRALLWLAEDGIVESKESRGETLWRLTRPLGLAVRDYLQKQERG